MREGNGETYLKKDGSKGMPRCVKCGVENYIPAVNSGECAWCGYNANNPKEEVEKCAS